MTYNLLIAVLVLIYATYRNVESILVMNMALVPKAGYHNFHFNVILHS